MTKALWRRLRLPLLLGSIALACDDPAPLSPVPDDHAATMIGVWTLASQPRPSGGEPSLNAGLRITLTIDSAEGDRFGGVVTTWFAGDVGVLPETFGRIEGRVAHERVILAIPVRSAGVTSLIVDARLTGDSLSVVSSSQGAKPGPLATGAVFLRMRAEQALHCLREGPPDTLWVGSGYFLESNCLEWGP